jgi:CubicO group peptidase (beta-lactamase class C family)
MCQSVTKSVVGDLIGCLVADGLLDPEAAVTRYVPELARSGYAGAKLQLLLDMQTGIRFVEDYYDPKSDSTKLDIACGWAPRSKADDPRSLYDLLAGIGREREHGLAFTYRSADTDALGWAAERATGRHLAELVGERIWSRLGTEHEAYICLDGVGTALADGGLCVTLRDLARFAEMHRNLGLGNGRQIVPADWVRSTRTGEHAKFTQEPFRSQMPNGAYRNQWWIGDVATGLHLGRGIYGQMIYIDPAAELTAVKFSTWPKPTMPEHIGYSLRAFAAIAARLGRA